MIKNIDHTLSRLLFFLLLGGSLLGNAGCATIFTGKKNTVIIQQGNPEGAQVFLDGVFLGEAPFKLRIDKHLLQQGSILEFRKPGYETQRYTVVRSVHGWYTVADILTGVIPLIIDTATGNIYRPNTQNVAYVLLPLATNPDGKEQKQ